MMEDRVVLKVTKIGGKEGAFVSEILTTNGMDVLGLLLTMKTVTKQLVEQVGDIGCETCDKKSTCPKASGKDACDELADIVVKKLNSKEELEQMVKDIKGIMEGR